MDPRGRWANSAATSCGLIPSCVLSLSKLKHVPEECICSCGMNPLTSRGAGEMLVEALCYKPEGRNSSPEEITENFQFN
jgi:hypothetical protein